MGITGFQQNFSVWAMVPYPSFPSLGNASCTVAVWGRLETLSEEMLSQVGGFQGSPPWAIGLGLAQAFSNAVFNLAKYSILSLAEKFFLKGTAILFPSYSGDLIGCV